MDDQETLPGTRRLFTHDFAHFAQPLKKVGDIVLIPQPTDSPRDPLIWSMTRKIWHSALVVFVTALTAATSNAASAAQYGQNIELKISFTTSNTAAGVLFIGMGFWVLISSPAVYLYGRRILYLLSMIWGLVGGIWFANCQRANDVIWSQFFVGASESVAEATVQLSLMDLWYQHQRGLVISVYVLAVSVGTYLGPLIGSYIASGSLGWRWIGWLQAIISGASYLVILLTLEETTFHPQEHTPTPTHITQNPTEVVSSPSDEYGRRNLAVDDDTIKKVSSSDAGLFEISQSLTHPFVEAKTYRQRMSIITPAPNLRGTGFKQYFRQLFHTLRVFTFPAVLFSGLQWGAQNAWLTFYLTAEDEFWGDAPWNYGASAIGNMNIPCIVGVVIGCVWGGWVSDQFVLWSAKRNAGIMEAERRLLLILPSALIFPTGLWLFGIGTQNGWTWPVPYVGLGFIGFGWGCVGDISMAYLMDIYPDMVLEGMVGVATIDSLMGCIFTFTASDWIDRSGVQNVFIAIGILSFVFILTTLPLIIWGKDMRRWTKNRYYSFLEVRNRFI